MVCDYLRGKWWKEIGSWSHELPPKVAEKLLDIAVQEAVDLALSESKKKFLARKRKKDPVTYSLEVIYLAAKQNDNPSKRTEENRRLRAAKTLRLKDELHARGLSEDVVPFHGKSGLPRVSSQAGYAAVHDTLVELNVIEDKIDYALVKSSSPRGPGSVTISGDGGSVDRSGGGGEVARSRRQDNGHRADPSAGPGLPTNLGLTKQEKTDLIAKLQAIEAELQTVKLEISSGDLFAPAYRAIQSGEGLSQKKKCDVIAEISDIETELYMVECFLTRRVRSILQSDPEIADVMLECLTNATARLVNSVSKIAQSN